MQKTLIIPDVHNNWRRAQEIIDTEAPDDVYFLGDIYDDFYDTPEIAQKVAIWHKKALNKDNYHFLFGNHDVSHFDPHKIHLCSGYTREKCNVINSIIASEDWRKTKFHAWIGKWLLTHAGLHPYLIPDYVATPAKLKKYLAREEENAWTALESKQPHWFFQVGYCRGGRDNIGGILWCDFNLEFAVIPGISQIFGHTPQPKPIKLKGERSMNICLDTRLNHYIVLLNNKLTIKEYSRECAEKHLINVLANRDQRDF